MKYSSLNRLQDFEFHDTALSFKYHKSGALCVTAEQLNIHKDAKENPYCHDMEIKNAFILFENFECLSFEILPVYIYDEHEKHNIEQPGIIYKGKQAEERLIAQLKNTIFLNGITIYQKDGAIDLELETNGNLCFIAFCSVSNVKIEWDEFSRKAWYELHEQYKYSISLETPAGEETAVLQIYYNEEKMFYSSEKTPIVSLSITYGDNEIYGNGMDYLWIDAFADLQKHLPKNVKIKCCLTCRHGNLCPVGNCPNEIFCTKDVEILQKSDLYFYTEDEAEIAKRSRNYTFVCEDFKEQNDDFYTYNDYLYYLKE